MGQQIEYLVRSDRYVRIINDRDFLEVGKTQEKTVIMRKGSSYHSVKELKQQCEPSNERDFKQALTFVHGELVRAAAVLSGSAPSTSSG